MQRLVVEAAHEDVGVALCEASDLPRVPATHALKAAQEGAIPYFHRRGVWVRGGEELLARSRSSMQLAAPMRTSCDCVASVVVVRTTGRPSLGLIDQGRIGLPTQQHVSSVTVRRQVAHNVHGIRLCVLVLVETLKELHVTLQHALQGLVYPGRELHYMGIKPTAVLI